MSEKIYIDPIPYLTVGKLVRVVAGPLKGVEGLLITKKKHCMLVISIDLMKQSVAVTIDRAFVEKID